jgi:hypothetical protein
MSENFVEPSPGIHLKLSQSIEIFLLRERLIEYVVLLVSQIHASHAIAAVGEIRRKPDIGTFPAMRRTHAFKALLAVEKPVR